MRNQLINKDKIIKEYDVSLKEHERIVNQLKKQNLEKEALNKELKQEFNEISARFKNLSVKLNSKEEEFLRTCNDYDGKIKSLEEDKVKTEEKVAEMIDIIKQQSKELSDFYVQFQLFDKEKKTLQKTNANIAKELEECIKANDELKSQFSVISDFRQKIIECDQNMDALHKQLYCEKEKLREEQEKNENLLVELERLKSRLSGENSPDYLRQVIDGKDNEISNLKYLFTFNLAKPLIILGRQIQ